MSWWAVDVCGGAEHRDALAAWLVARTGQAVEQRDDGTLITFAEDEQSADALIAGLNASPDPDATAARRPLEPVDWTTRWRDGLVARRIGRLVVRPSWVDAALVPDEVDVVVDPEMAFGTGEHGSTRAALALLVRLIRPGDQVLDLGSGSGILSIAAVRLGAARATGIEVDAEANIVARRNAEQNGVGPSCKFLDGEAGALAPLLGPADFVLSNILRTANLELLPAIRSALRPGGIAVFSGMEEGEAPLFRPALEAGFTVELETTDAGWWAVAARRR
jgi:ribosomal protein L11 methyltransferase